MKKFIYFVFVLFLTIQTIFSQTDSKGFNFQGYAIDPDGKALGSTGVTIKFSIYPQGGSDEYTEEINVTTDAFGVFSAVIGSKAPNEFEKINFNAKVYWLKVEVKKTSGGVYTTIHEGQFQSVPYARSAANGVPVGSIIPFGGPASAIPLGWLPCDGRLLSKLNYPQLGFVLGYSWGGSGDNFNIPDLRGYFLRGVADGQTTDPDRASRTNKTGAVTLGDVVGSYQNDSIEKHNHTGKTISDGVHNHKQDNNDVQVIHDGYDTAEGFDNNDGSNSSEINLSTTHGLHNAGAHTHTIPDDGGAETRPKNAYVWFIIKY